MDEDKYIEGFNDGFLIATHRPEAAQDLVKAYQESPMPYFEGLKDGVQEKHIELELDVRESRMDELNRIRGKSNSRENEIEQ